MIRILRLKNFRLIAPLAILALVVAACSPGSAQTRGPVFNPNGDNINLTGICLLQTQSCVGYVSVNYVNFNGTGLAAHYFSNKAASAGGFSTLDNNGCSSSKYGTPCPEGGFGALNGDGLLYQAGSMPMPYSYCVRVRDDDGGAGSTVQGTDTIDLMLVPGVAGGCTQGQILTALAGKAPVGAISETFTCTNDCLQVDLRPGFFGIG